MKKISECKGKSGSSVEETCATQSRREEDPDGSIRVYHQFSSNARTVAVLSAHYLGHFGLGAAIVGGSLMRDCQNRAVVSDGPLLGLLNRQSDYRPNQERSSRCNLFPALPSVSRMV